MPPDYDAQKTLPKDNREVPLVARLEPSRRHPAGLPRCRRIIRRPGERAYQCKRAARAGLPVCGHHGAGFLSREQSGARQSVRSNLRHGARSRPDTLAAVIEEWPHLRVLLDSHEPDEDDREVTYRRILVLARGLLDLHLDRMDTDDPAQLARGIRLCRSVGELTAKLVAVENRHGPISNRRLERAIRGAADTFDVYVPEELRSEAIHFYREHLGPDAVKLPTGLREYSHRRLPYIIASVHHSEGQG